MTLSRPVVLSFVVVFAAVAGLSIYLFARPAGPENSPAAGVATAQNGGFRGPGGPRGAAPLVVTAPVTSNRDGMDVRAIGTVAAVRAVTIYPEATGVVAEVRFRPGTQVEAGEVLLRLDETDQRVALDRARIARDAAQAASDRAEQLARSSNITSVALADARTALQKAEIDVQAATNDLAKRTITAPFAGTVGLSDVTVGDLVNSSKAITTLDDMSKVTVSFVVPERASGRVAVGQPVTATTEALAGQTFAGTVSAVDSRVDPTARTLRVEATLPNDANVLKPGMALAVGLSFPGETHPEVPSLAVQWDRDGAYVWKLAGDKVQRTPVQILGRRSGAVIVVGDLTAGDEVVVEGLQRLRDGATVMRVGGDNGGAVEPPLRQPPAGAGGAASDLPEAGADARRQRPVRG